VTCHGLATKIKIFFIFFSFIICNSYTSGQAQTPWERKAWVAKSVRTLWGSNYSLSRAELESLSRKSDSEFLTEIIENSRTAEFLVRFNLLWMGLNPDQSPDRFAPKYFSQSLMNLAPGAFYSAKEFLKNGDYFVIFNTIQPLYLSPLNERPFPANLSPEKLTEERLKTFQNIRDIFQATLVGLKSGLPPPGDYCKNFETLQEGTFSLRAFVPPAIFEEYNRSAHRVAFLRARCPDQNFKVDEKFIKRFEDVQNRNLSFLKSLEAFEYSLGYKVEKLSDLKELDLGPLQFTHRFFSSLIGYAIQNNTGNYNRTRAKYVLTKFFCDELFENVIPDHEDFALVNHRHLRSLSDVSSPACMSCHFRLDPMAGFFKDLGFRFQPFGGQTIDLDDGNRIDRQIYQTVWKSSLNTGRTWDIGYRRSLNESSNNFWGEKISDLEAILKSAPEVKTCLTQKLYKHLVGENQLVDAAFIKELADEFKKVPGPNSSIALKSIIRRILASQAFKNLNPDPRFCYDRPESSSSNFMPCEMTEVFQRNCVSCHASTSKGIQLSSLLKDTNGKHYFIHLDERGYQLPREASFRGILERLNSQNSEFLMPPPSRHLNFKDKKKLEDWLNKELLQ